MAERPKPRIASWPGALDWFIERLSLKRAEVADLERRARRNGKRASELTKLRASNAVFEAIAIAAKDGKTLPQVREALAKSVVDAAKLNLDLAFINNVQRSYNAGRVREFMDPDVLEVRPFWVYDALLDGRTTQLCRSCNGTVLPASSRWWKTHTPPLHHRCRSTIRAVRPEEAKALGIDATPPRVKASDGFGRLSDALPPPDLSGVDPDLRRIWRRKK